MRYAFPVENCALSNACAFLRMDLPIGNFRKTHHAPIPQLTRLGRTLFALFREAKARNRSSSDPPNSSRMSTCKLHQNKGVYPL